MSEVLTAEDYRTAARVCRYRGLYGSADTFDGEADAIDTEVSRFEALGRAVQLLHEQAAIATDGQFFHDFGRALGDFLPSVGYELTTDDEAPNLAAVAQEPRRFTDVKPEFRCPTGPHTVDECDTVLARTQWATWRDVPEGVRYRSHDFCLVGVWVNREDTRYYCPNAVDNEWQSTCRDSDMQGYAPFVRVDHE